MKPDLSQEKATMNAYMSVYQANTRILQNNLEIDSLSSKEHSAREDIKSIKSQIETEKRREREALERRAQIDAEIVITQMELDDEQAKTDALLGNKAQAPRQQFRGRETEPPRPYPKDPSERLTVCRCLVRILSF